MPSLLALGSIAFAAVPAAASPLAPFDLHRGETSAFTLSETPLASPGGVVDIDSVYARKYVRHLNLANAGLITLGVGVGVTTVSVVVLVGGAVSGNDGTALLGIGGMALGLVGSNVGQILFSIGGLEAAYDLRAMGRNGPVVMGWVTCGMMAAGLVTYVGAVATIDPTSTESSPLSIVSSAFTVGALVPGFITYFNVRHEGVDLRASLVPTLVPVQLADGSLGSVPGLAVSAAW